MKKYHINISAPNLVNICVDKSADGEMNGRLYHCYKAGFTEFSNSLQLLKVLDEFYDCISFPQASTETRYFVEPEYKVTEKPDKVTTQEDIIRHAGEEATFIVYVQYRQKSTWQGEVTWIEQEVTQQFISTLELIKLLDNALGLM